MKTAYRLLAVIATATLLAPLGCGGGGGGTIPSSQVVGVWGGNQVSRVEGAIEFEFIQDGAAIYGGSRITLAGEVYTGTSVGTHNGDNFDVTVDFGSAYGKIRYIGAASGNALAGTYTRTQGSTTENGDISLTRSSQVTTQTLTNTNWTGTSTPSEGEPTALSLAFGTQTNNSLVIGVNAGSGTVQASGMIIGNKMTFRYTVSEGVTATYTGTLGETTLSGTYVVSSGGSGAFTVTKQ